MCSESCLSVPSVHPAASGCSDQLLTLLWIEVFAQRKISIRRMNKKFNVVPLPAASTSLKQVPRWLVPRPVPHQFFFCCSYRADSDFPLYCVGAERSIQDFPGVRSPLNPLYKSVDWRVRFYKVLAAIVAFLIMFRIIRPDDLNGLFPTG